MAATGNMNKFSPGFTLIEVLVALAIAGITLSAVYAIFLSQSKTYSTQDQIVELQQDLRRNVLLLERELRQAGYNPGGLTQAVAETDAVDNDCDGSIDEIDNAATVLVNEAEVFGFLRIMESSVTFAQDGNGDGTACGDKETITYALNGMTLERNGAPLSENIEVLNFVYLDRDGGIASSIEDVRSVQIAIVGRSKHEDPSYRHGKAYLNLRGTEILAAQSDGYRRRSLMSQVHIRNLKD